jgi:predicted short-subunit dehydrogenase-like oxidoreductase (DUF2520 family)
MLPGMSEKAFVKPHIAIIGAGNVADALAVSLHRAGYVIDQIIARGGGSSLQRTRQLAREVGASAVVASEAQLKADLVWFCVPDGAIASAAQSLAKAADWKGKLAVHSSGALTSNALAVLRRRGAAVASVHPLMTFVRGSRPVLAGVPFAIEGDQKAVRTARAIVFDLRGQPFSIGKQQKAAYHAWGMFASPLLTALLALGERVAAAAGVSRKSAKKRMLPILRQTLDNYAALGAPGAFSGPIVRGDTETVKRHLAVLRNAVGARKVYLALAAAALHDLPTKNRAALEKILER